ncbi:MAG: hypothetical protein P0Y53_18470 [Candidatus Pseudobacter hemicellulosilyticus]|uniref:Uncharacterized protein n=1 Tax=Candidatus Pseudobacter hemicellulosilyticus TaxID=3121375 RepID=A0AAJ6BGT6_9BACT|nr:MAG: hypothetical protein P0Y53_18470 [Pseudobacter sp.]
MYSTSLLTPGQIAALAGNRGLSKSFRREMQQELHALGQTTESAPHPVLCSRGCLFSALPRWLIGLMIFFPFMTTLAYVLSEWFVIRGDPGRLRDFWWSIGIGYSVWTIGLFLFLLF